MNYPLDSDYTVELASVPWSGVGLGGTFCGASSCPCGFLGGIGTRYSRVKVRSSKSGGREENLKVRACHIKKKKRT